MFQNKDSVVWFVEYCFFLSFVRVYVAWDLIGHATAIDDGQECHKRARNAEGKAVPQVRSVGRAKTHFKEMVRELGKDLLNFEFIWGFLPYPPICDYVVSRQPIMDHDKKWFLEDYIKHLLPEQPLLKHYVSTKILENMIDEHNPGDYDLFGHDMDRRKNVRKHDHEVLKSLVYARFWDKWGV
jgi:hypothetical protein